MADETKNKKKIGWKDRHAEIKRYKNNTKNTWLHLVVGENLITNEKVLRLLKPYNYFSIPNKETYKKIVNLLRIGGNEIDWLDKDGEALIDHLENSVKNEIKKIAKKQSEGKKLSDDEKEILKVIQESGLETKNVLELIQKIKGSSDLDINKTTKLLEEISLHDINSFSEQIKVRLEKIKLFKRIAMDNNTYEIRGENSIHRFLEKNMWILDERYWLMHSNEQLRTIVGEEVEKDPKKRPDFVCGQIDKKIIIIELKRPKHDLAVKDLNQLENYLKIIENHFTDYTSFEGYLVGKSISPDLEKTKKYRSNQFKIRTFVDFISDVEKRYAEFKK